MPSIQSQLIEMGKMEVAAAEAKFIQDLVDSIPAPPVKKEIIDLCISLIKGDTSIKKIITDAAISAAEDAGMVRV